MHTYHAAQVVQTSHTLQSIHNIHTYIQTDKHTYVLTYIHTYHTVPYSTIPYHRHTPYMNTKSTYITYNTYIPYIHTIQNIHYITLHYTELLCIASHDITSIRPSVRPSIRPSIHPSTKGHQLLMRTPQCRGLVRHLPPPMTSSRS